MAVVTAIDKQPRRRAGVYLDGELTLLLRRDLVLERRLTVGAIIGPTLREQLEAEDDRLTAVEAALKLLAAGPRSERDLRERLQRRKLRAEAVNTAVGRMRELGYLNDVVFARSFVESRLSGTPRSRHALAFELGQRGINREIASAAVADLSDEDAAYQAAQRRLRSLRGLDREAFARRLNSFLASRGFGYSVARSAIDRCWALSSEPSQT